MAMAYEMGEFIGTYVQGVQEWLVGQGCTPLSWVGRELFI